jgi:hypothetical protein
MSRSDTPILRFIRYKAVARLQLTHFFWPRVGCLCDCPIYVTVIGTTKALVTFHTKRVYTVQHVVGPRLKLLTCDNFFRRVANDNSPAERKFT